MDVLRLFGEIVINAIIRVQAESALRQKNEALATTVAELERSNEELQQFAYISSHDLQEPLRSIGGFSELLRRHYADKLDARGLSYVEFINNAAKRLHHLVVGLLDYSRVDARARPFEACGMDSVLGLALDNLSASIQDSTARITHDPLPAVPGDAAQLTVLLQNLIGNALKFHGESPPRVHVAVRTAPAPDSGWEFTVRDNGIGIAPSDARKLFQIFRRLHSADKYPGTGIGLAVCKRIVARHNGRIWVEANPEGGCSFCFTLPALPENTAAAAA
jgi:light-regulated signal transduction histidine kinase (bacteriophytochrome)